VKQFLSARGSRGAKALCGPTHRGDGQIHIWNNNLFEFSMIPGLPDSRNPS